MGATTGGACEYTLGYLLGLVGTSLSGNCGQPLRSLRSFVDAFILVDRPQRRASVSV